ADAPPAPAGERRALLRQPGILLFLAVSALYTLASVGMEQTIAFYVQDTLRLTPEGTARTVGMMLAVFGLLAAAVQGGAMRPLSRKFAPGPLISLGLLVMGAGMFLLPLGESFWPITAALAVVGVGSAVLGPSLSAALSLSAGGGQQGAVAGLNSSALALGRMTGPLIGTGLYQGVSHAAPYFLSGGILLALLLWTLIARPQVRPAQGAKV
ncbi:MFS transporter, partial [Deinococcus sp. MIMF12]